MAPACRSRCTPPGERSSTPRPSRAASTPIPAVAETIASKWCGVDLVGAVVHDHRDRVGARSLEVAHEQLTGACEGGPVKQPQAVAGHVRPQPAQVEALTACGLTRLRAGTKRDAPPVGAHPRRGCVGGWGRARPRCSPRWSRPSRTAKSSNGSRHQSRRLGRVSTPAVGARDRESELGALVRARGRHPHSVGDLLAPPGRPVRVRDVFEGASSCRRTAAGIPGVRAGTRRRGTRAAWAHRSAARC